ncbi:MAG: RNA-guided endonuclease TnpB family protein [Chloroflexota bacterium]
MTILSHRIRLDLNNVQETWFNRCAGAARWAYNQGLARWQELYKADEKTSWQGLNKELNASKPDWLRELPWKISNGALEDLGRAFTNFFAKRAKYPNFKKRGRCRDGFSLDAREVRFDGTRIRIPRLGWVRTREILRFPGKVLSVRFTKQARHWYASAQVEIDESWSYPHVCETQAAVGVDMGVKDLAVLSDGTRVPAPRILRRLEGKLRMLNKRLSRRAKGGKNWLKAKAQLGRLHERIANIRKDVTHNLTARLVCDFKTIVIEDLNIKGMASNSHLAKSIIDAAMGEVRRQLEYKAPLAGSDVLVAGRWFASSKTCSDCEHVLDVLPLSVREWICPVCGSVHDRDVNAGINLKKLAAARAVTALSQGSSGPVEIGGAKLPFVGEPSSHVNQ